MSALRAVDPNDLEKSKAIFFLIFALASRITLEDTSKGAAALEDEFERKISVQSAQFEVFISEYLDACIALIETASAVEFTGEEELGSSPYADALTELDLAGVFCSLLGQSSEAVYDVALNKMSDYLRGRILSGGYASSGRIAAQMCFSLARVRPEKALGVFLPPAIEVIRSRFREDPKLAEREIVDNEVKFNLMLVSNVVEMSGSNLLPFLPSIERVLDLALTMAEKDGHHHACRVLQHTVGALVAFRSVKRPWAGKSFRASALGPEDWCEPDEAALREAARLLDKYLGQQLEALSQYASHEVDLTKEQLYRRLTIVEFLIFAAAPVLPVWGETGARSHCRNVLPTDADGRNTRLRVIEAAMQVQKRLQATDDTNSAERLVTIYRTAILNRGCDSWDGYRSDEKELLSDQRFVYFMGLRRRTRADVVVRVLREDEARGQETPNKQFTETHRKVNLIRLCYT